MIRPQDRGSRFEEVVARKINGSVVKGSGCGRYHKGDVITDHFLVQCKSTAATQFILKHSELRQAAREADGKQKYPAFAVELGGHDYILIDIEFLPILEEALCRFGSTT